MLSWPPGPQPEDGVWGAIWYDAVNRSNGFDGPEAPLPELNEELAALSDRLRPAYEAMAAHKLSITKK